MCVGEAGGVGVYGCISINLTQVSREGGGYMYIYISISLTRRDPTLHPLTMTKQIHDDRARTR